MTRLRLATREQDTFEAAFSKQITAFKQLNPDVDIEVVANPIHDHYEQMVHTEGADEQEIDLLLCCTDWIPEAVDRELLENLDARVKSNPPEDWPTGWHRAMHELTTVDGSLYGLPWHDGPELFHYRADLFENPEEKSSYLARNGQELRPPQTWDEFLSVALFFTRPAHNLWGSCIGAYTDGHNNVYDFLIHLWSRGGTLFDESWKPRFNERPGIEALRYLFDLVHTHQVVSPDCLGMGSVECGDYYAQGNAAMMWNWAGFAAVCELPQYSKIVGQNRCTHLPRKEGHEPVSLNIYWVLCLLDRSKHNGLAYDFMRFVTSPAMDKVTSMSGANGTRLSTWRDPEIQALYPYYNQIESVHGSSRTLPAIPEYPALNEIISLAVHNVMHGGMPIDAELDLAAFRCETLLRGAGRLK